MRAGPLSAAPRSWTSRGTKARHVLVLQLVRRLPACADCLSPNNVQAQQAMCLAVPWRAPERLCE